MAHRFSRDDAGIVRAPAAALVVGVDVAPDDVVEAGRAARRRRGDEDGDRHHRRRSRSGPRRLRRPQRAGRRRRALVPHRAVTGDDADVPVGAAIDLAGLQRPPPTTAGRALDARPVRAFMLGFDVEAGRARQLLEPQRRRGRRCRSTSRAPLAVFDAFSDLVRRRDEAARSGRRQRRRRGPASTSTPTSARSTSSARALPAWFGDGSCGPLAHYGVTRPRPQPRARGVAAADLRRPAAPRRAASDRDGPARRSARPAGRSRRRRRDRQPAARTLDRLIDATRSGATRRSPACRARVRHRRFDQPLRRPSPGRDGRHDAAPRRPASPTPADRAAMIDELVACPCPLLPILAEDNLLASSRVARSAARGADPSLLQDP